MYSTNDNDDNQAPADGNSSAPVGGGIVSYFKGVFSSRREDAQDTREGSSQIGTKYKHLRVFNSPMCLIKNDDNGSLMIADDVLKEISSIEDTVNVIAIAGPYRSGKSYLMNRLAGVSQGFPLGSTTKAKTKGIWVWCKEHPKRPAEVLMLIDTEGIGDIDQADERTDINILCLATLLSGTFVYNIIGRADKDLLNNLSFVTNISKKVILRKKESSQEYDRNLPDEGLFFPSFVLCLRDFTLSLGEYKSAHDYFKDCLKTNDEKTDEKTKQYNELKIRFKQYFRERSCFTFDRPTADLKNLAKLDEIQFSELGTEFQKDTKLFLDHIFECKPKEFSKGSFIHGRMLSGLIEEFTRVLQSEEIACIHETMTNMFKKENNYAVKKAVEMLKSNLESIGIPLPADFESQYERIQQEALETFCEKVFFDNKQEIQKQAKEGMEKVKNEILEKNRVVIKEKAKKEMQSMYDDSIKPEVEKDAYFVPGGYKAYRDDFAKLREDIKQRYPVEYSDLVQTCALEIEGTYREQDEHILERADSSESDRYAKVEGQKKSLEDQKKNLEKKIRELDTRIESMKLTTIGTLFKTGVNLVPLAGPLTTMFYDFYGSRK